MCLWIVDNPRACHHCQQSFCENCIAPWLRHTSNCPKCEGYITQKILLDTTAAIQELLLDFAYKMLSDPERKKKENLLAYIETLRKEKEEFQALLFPNELKQQKAEKSIAEKTDDYIKSLSGMQKDIEDLINVMSTTRKVAWKSSILRTKENIDAIPE